uniref:Uncharacterized protein n=1 Tax=Arundo donax TaxID=35708 RepID=A0A0A8ZHI6_ARUDO
MFMVYRMAIIKMELRLRFPHYNVSVISGQNSSLVFLPCELSRLFAPP